MMALLECREGTIAIQCTSHDASRNACMLFLYWVTLVGRHECLLSADETETDRQMVDDYTAFYPLRRTNNPEVRAVRIRTCVRRSNITSVFLCRTVQPHFGTFDWTLHVDTLVLKVRIHCTSFPVTSPICAGKSPLCRVVSQIPLQRLVANLLQTCWLCR